MNSNISIVPLNKTYLVFTADTDHDLAKRTFAARFKHEPEQVIEERGYIHVGPVKGEE